MAAKTTNEARLRAYSFIREFLQPIQIPFHHGTGADEVMKYLNYWTNKLEGKLAKKAGFGDDIKEWADARAKGHDSKESWDIANGNIPIIEEDVVEIPEITNI